MKKLNRLIQTADHRLGSIKQHAEKLVALTRKIQPLLPEEWRDSCMISRISEHAITISTSEQAAITLLRFMQPQILRGIRAIPALKQVHEIHIVYAPTLNPPDPVHPDPARSQEAAAACKDAAANCPKPLEKALKKLAKTLEKK